MLLLFPLLQIETSLMEAEQDKNKLSFTLSFYGENLLKLQANI